MSPRLFVGLFVFRIRRTNVTGFRDLVRLQNGGLRRHGGLDFKHHIVVALESNPRKGRLGGIRSCRTRRLPHFRQVLQRQHRRPIVVRDAAPRATVRETELVRENIRQDDESLASLPLTRPASCPINCLANQSRAALFLRPQ